LADELNDRVSDGTQRDAALQPDELDEWVQDLFERIYETVSLMNVDFYRNDRGITLTGNRLAPTAIPNDGLVPRNQAMGGRDALRNPNLTIPAVTNVDPLPLAQHARTRHRALADLGALREFVALHPGRLQTLIRRPFEVEPGESTGEQTTMRMPPFMRQSNALPLTLSAWQYELLMAWVGRVQPAPPGAAGAAPPAPRPSRAAARRRAAVLDRLDRAGERTT
jgi:hypothetical protein